MSLLDILFYPDPQLRKTAASVDNVDGQTAAFIDELFETMYAAPGIGLAASQVNVHERIFVVDVSEDNSSPLAFVNPEIRDSHGLGETQEGCLSIPGFYEVVKRPAQIHVAALDRDGNPFELEADGLLAVCIQHELDHLNGTLFVDYLSSLKRNRIRKKMMRWIRDGADPEDLPGNG